MMTGLVTWILILTFVLAGLIFLRRRDWEKSSEMQRLEQCVYRLRLSKMLDHLGLDPREYLNRCPAELIAEHIENCRTCQATDICDDLFRDKHPVEDMHFCRNYSSLNAISDYFTKQA